LPVIFYGCETWSLILRDESRMSVFENRVLRRIYETKRDELTGEWGKLHTEELYDLYSSPDIIRVIKSRRMRWAEHVACMGQRRGVYRVWWRSLRERDNLEDPGFDGRIILRWLFRKWDVEAWSGFIWLRIGTGGGHL